MDAPKQTPLDALRAQLLDAARAFATDRHPAGELLSQMVDDVARAGDEPLEIFPVCHHSPSSALHLVRRLRERAPKVIFVEMCEDLRPLVGKLRDCKLPVALQAFALGSEAFPRDWSPLSVVAPLTEFSAEYQAIAYALEHPETELRFVDRSVDHVFRWLPQEPGELEKHLNPDGETDDEADAPAPGVTPAPGAQAETEDEGGLQSHGAAIGVEMGRLEPTFDAFLQFLLRNARVRHFAEWWDQYVEQAIIGADYATYRAVMFLVGSLMRRLGRKDQDRETDLLRERYMWTRMKQHLAASGVAPGDAIYLCGAVHAVSEVPEFGTRTDARWDIPAPTATAWLYGLIPSSYVAIERQFRHPPGTVALADTSWEKSLAALGIKSFSLAKAAAAAGAGKTRAGKAKAAAATATATAATAAAPVNTAVTLPLAAALTDASTATLSAFLTRPPTLTAADEEQLLRWSVEIVGLARKNGYLASTADAIAIYQTAVLLANLRNRLHPTPYDFEDAAITCLEKDAKVKKRDVRRLCQILLGGNRTGRVGYDALPPLAQDVYDRLKPLGVDLRAGTIQRALLDLDAKPALRACSDVLWMLRFLTTRGGTQHSAAVRPIMGERKLGSVAQKESWDIAIGKHQESVITLAYEGVTLEHVIERRLKAAAWKAGQGAVHALAAVEDSLLYLSSPRLTEELGERAVELLAQETAVKDAPETVRRVRALVHFYRSRETGLPPWLKQFVTTGYSHYATLLPEAFADRGTRPAGVAGMLEFIFQFESLALSLGSQRSQLLIAVAQAGPVTTDPTKLGLLWAAEWLLGLRDVATIRAFLDQTLDNALMLPVFPDYVSGFLLALGFTPLVGRLVVELLSKAFARLPEEILFPWLPSLLLGLRPYGHDLIPVLLKDAGGVFPRDLKALAGWTAPWDREAAPAPAGDGSAAAAGPPAGASAGPRATPAPATLSPTEQAVAALLTAHPAAAESLAALLTARA